MLRVRSRALAMLAAVLVAASGFTVVGSSTGAEAASATAGSVDQRIVPASMAGFDAGNIIEDAVFFAKDTMSPAAIQGFLNSKVSQCQSGYTCLKDYGMATITKPADLMCRSTYVGSAFETAAQIIYNVAQACGINPQVLLVTLQKEQSLVTHTSPSAARYRIAMGQGCPDTAACDSRYYGFFNQVYGAAWQFKRYANPPGTNQTFTWYAPGKTWNILFHPNRACGTAPVYVRNQATANLYYYTPYQPNAAARAANYGLGDGCSSYGNRNFYNYFTDWFGSTRATNVTLVRTEADPTIHLVSGTKRWRVLDFEDYTELNRVLGPTYIVGDAFVAGLTDSGASGAVLRDESTGVISLVQGGQSHRFATCELVVLWGASCSAPVNVSPAIANRAPAGAQVSAYFRLRGSTRWGHLDGASAATPLYDEAAARAFANAATAPSAFYVTSAHYRSLTLKPLAFAPAQLVRANESTQVYLTDGYSRLQRVETWSDVVPYNRAASQIAWVSQAELSAGYRVAASVEPLIRCGTVTYYAAMGRLHVLTDSARTGLGTMSADVSTCRMFPVAPDPLGGTLLVKSASDAWVYLIEGGTRHLLPTWPDVLTATGGSPPRIVTIANSTLAELPAETPRVDGTIVKTAQAPALSLVSGSVGHSIPSFALGAELGLAMTYLTIPQTDAASLSVGAPLGHWIRCGGEVLFGGGGGVRAVDASASAGFPVIELSPAACTRLRGIAGASLPDVFVKATGSPQVYLADAGSYRPVSTWGALLGVTGGVSPTIVELAPQILAGLPKGAAIS